jgi:hypothetical protein
MFLIQDEKQRVDISNLILKHLKPDLILQIKIEQI